MALPQDMPAPIAIIALFSLFFQRTASSRVTDRGARRIAVAVNIQHGFFFGILRFFNTASTIECLPGEEQRGRRLFQTRARLDLP